MKSKFNAMEHIEDLNVIRSIFTLAQVPFTAEEFRDRLREKNIPSSTVFVNEMKNAGIIVNTEEGLLAFATKQPIHYKVLETVYSNYTERLKQYQRAYRSRKEAENMLESQEVEKAVQFLKEKGFEIYAPVNSLYKKM